MLVMLGWLAGFYHELQPRSVPLCLCRTALPLSHCLAFVTLPVGRGSVLGPSAVSLIWAFSVGRALTKLLSWVRFGCCHPHGVLLCVVQYLNWVHLGPALVHV